MWILSGMWLLSDATCEKMGKMHNIEHERFTVLLGVYLEQL